MVPGTGIIAALPQTVITWLFPNVILDVARKPAQTVSDVTTTANRH